MGATEMGRPRRHQDKAQRRDGRQKTARSVSYPMSQMGESEDFTVLLVAQLKRAASSRAIVALLAASRLETIISIVPPSIPVTVPPASCTNKAPAATSHGFRLVDQNASIRPDATQARFRAAEPLRWTVCRCLMEFRNRCTAGSFGSAPTGKLAIPIAIRSSVSPLVAIAVPLS